MLIFVCVNVCVCVLMCACMCVGACFIDVPHTPAPLVTTSMLTSSLQMRKFSFRSSGRVN